MRKRIIWLVTLLLCMPNLFLVTAEAGAAPTYSLKVNKQTHGQVTLTLSGKNISNLYGYEARFSFDSDKLELLEFKSNRKGFSVSPIVKNNEIIIAHTKTGKAAGDRGDMVIGTLKFKIKKNEKTTVKWKSMKVVTDKLKSTTVIVGQSVSISKGKINPSHPKTKGK